MPDQFIKPIALTNQFLASASTLHPPIPDQTNPEDSFKNRIEALTADPEATSKATPPDPTAEQKKLFEACQEMESVLVYQMLSTMRQSIPKTDLMGQSLGIDIFESMLDEEYAKLMSKSGEIGLANDLYRELAKNLPGADSNSPPFTLNLPIRPAPVVTRSATQAGSTLPSAAPIKTALPAEKNATPWDHLIKTISQKYGIDSRLTKAVMQAESNFNPESHSKAGACGLMQLMPATARALGIKNIWDPVENIAGGVRYLRQMLDQFDQNLHLALAAYNAGPGNVKKYGGIPPFKETQNYVQKVLSYLK